MACAIFRFFLSRNAQNILNPALELPREKMGLRGLLLWSLLQSHMSPLGCSMRENGGGER